MASSYVCGRIGNQTSVRKKSKNNLREIHISQGLFWGSPSLSPYFLLAQVTFILRSKALEFTNDYNYLTDVRAKDNCNKQETGHLINGKLTTNGLFEKGSSALDNLIFLTF